MNRNLFSHLAVLSANLIYGANYTIAKMVMPEYIRPFGFIVLRVVVTAVIFWMLGLADGGKKVERGDLLRLFFCALFGVAINQLLFFKGLDLTYPINAALMMTTNPIMVLVAASLLIGERITARKVTGIAIGLTGACTLLLWGKNFSYQSSSFAGDMMVLINSLSFGVFLIIVKPMMQKYSTITVMKWVFLFGTFLVFPFGYNEFKAIAWHSFDTSTWLATAYVVIAVTSLAYLLNTVALKNLSPSSVSAYIYLQPLFATSIAIILGADSPQWIHLAAAVLIFTGVYLVTSGMYARMKDVLRSTEKS
jgi:drug/metabolite transporter (DMT)-like permease